MISINSDEPMDWDQYLQQKIDYEIKMRDGTAKLLAASKHPHQMLEAAKNLLTSNTRMIAYMSELQKRKTDEVMKRKRAEDGNQVPCKGKISVSDLRIPLMWKDTDHFKNKGDSRRYAVFCIWKIGTEIFDTTLIKEVDRSMTDLTFEDVIVFNDIDPNFECQLEVYSHKLVEDLTIASTPRKLKKKFNEISSSVGRSVGKRLSGLRDDPEFMANMLVGPKYELVGQATLSLKDVSDYVGIFDLNIENNANTENNNHSMLPLFGHFSCRLAAQPSCLVTDTAKGHVQIKSEEHDWKPLWCRLCNLRVSCWESEELAEKEQDPVLTIPVTKCSQISQLNTASSERKYCLQITTDSQSSSRQQFTLSFESQEVLNPWWDGLQQHMLDQVMWQHACDSVMEIKDASPQRLPAFMRKGTGNLYDDTPWKESPVKKQAPMPSMMEFIKNHCQEQVPGTSTDVQGKYAKVQTDV
jgi:hypothetical protein